jgi:integrase/recombinase XerD
MTPIASHITSFLQQRLPIERRVSDNTCESYAYAFKLLFEYASTCLKISPSELHFEQLDSIGISFFWGVSGARRAT